jgi:hypothetical protein
MVNMNEKTKLMLVRIVVGEGYVPSFDGGVTAICVMTPVR